jgi:hypothetical protein
MKDTKPRRAARVVNSERTESVDLYRFDRSGNEVPRHPKALKDYLAHFDHFVPRTSSQEFKNFYEKVFSNPAWKSRIIWEVVPLR